MSTSGLTQTYQPNTLDGLNVIEADQIYLDGQLVNLDNFVPYIGATQVLNMGAFAVQSSHIPSSGNDLINYTTLINAITNQDTTNDVTYLNKITNIPQTVQATTTFLNGLLSSHLEVDANYQTLLSSADVSVSQNFGSISNVGIVYQATTDTASGTPILIAFPIVSGRKYRISIEILVEDPTYGWYIEILQSTDNINPITSGTIDVFLIPTGSTAYTLSDHSFVALTTGSVIIQATTDAPSTNDQAVKWKNLSTYEMGVSLENATYPSLTGDRVAVLNERKQLVSSGISITKLDYLDNVSSDIQTQLNTLSSTKADTSYVDSQDALRVPYTGATTGLDMGAQKITTTYVPVNGPDLINKTYADATYATSSALSAYLPLSGGTLTGNLTVSTGNTVSLVDGLTVSTNTRSTTANLSGSTINGTHVSATITTLPSPPPVYNITYSGSFSGGLTSSFFPTPGLTYRYTFTKIWRQGLPGGILTVQFLQDVSTITGLVGFPLTPTISITPTSYATSTTITGTFTPPQAGALFLSFYSVSGGATSFYWDDFSLVDITASVSAPLSLTKSITQPINSSAEFAGGLQVSQYDLGLSASGFITTGLPTGLNGGTLSGPSGSFYRLTALSGQAEMAMRPSLLAPLVGERYTYVFRGIRSSVPLTLQVIQSVSVNVISTQPFTNNITTELQDITGSFISANNTTANAFRFSAGSANPWVEWATFSLFRSDTNVRGLLTCGGNTSMLGNATVAGTASITGNTTMAGTATIGSTLRNVGLYILGNALTPTNGLIRMTTAGGVNFIQSGLTETGSSSADLVFGSIFAGNEWMRIKANGRVGIGANNPTAPITVNGSITIRDSPGNNTYEAGCIYTDANWGMLFRGAVNALIAHMRWDRSDGTTLMKIQNTGVLSFNGGGTNFAVDNGFTTRAGAICIGNISTNYGGGWQAGLMMECADTTEISCHDSGSRLTSFIYYDGGNRLYIGRDIGYGATPITIPSSLTVSGETYCNNWFRNVGNGGLWNETYARGIRCSDAEGNPYGNISTHGTGRNGWSGYGLTTKACLMVNSSNIFGIHDNGWGWVLYCLGNSAREVTIGGGVATFSRNFDRCVMYANGDNLSGGYFYYNAGNAYGTISDRRIKKDFQSITTEQSVAFLKALEPTSFCLKESEPCKTKLADGTEVEECGGGVCCCRQDGWVAQNVLEACKRSGASKSVINHWYDYEQELEKPEEERKTLIGVSDRPILSHTVNVVKVLMERVEKLEIENLRLADLAGQVLILEAREAVWVEHAKQQEAIIEQSSASLVKLRADVEKLASIVSQLISTK